MQIIKEIQHRVEDEARTNEELYITVKDNMVRMFFSGSMSKEQVVTVCSSLIKLYKNLSKEK